MSQLTLIVAATTKNGIGWTGTIPWHLQKDLAYFKRVTMNAPAGQMNALLMGKKTWESIPLKFRPLAKRINIVLSRNKDYDLATSATNSTHLSSDLKNAAGTFGSQNDVHRLFIIGGSSLYQEALTLGPHHSNDPSLQADRILMTRIYDPEFKCDAFFPDVLGGTEWNKTSHEELCTWVGFEVPAGIQMENGIEFEFQMWIRSPV